MFRLQIAHHLQQLDQFWLRVPGCLGEQVAELGPHGFVGLAVLKRAQASTPVPELCREHRARFYQWSVEMLAQYCAEESRSERDSRDARNACSNTAFRW